MTAFDDFSKTLVVLERDSDWPDWLRPLQFADGRVIAQAELESPSRLAQRVRRTVESTSLAGEPLRVAILGCNDRFDEPAFRARTEIAHTLLAALQHSSSACLRLTASARHSGRSHHALSEFARGLSERWEGRGILVSARFGGHGPTRLASQLGPVGDALRVA
jgi:hypothetical protein